MQKTIVIGVVLFIAVNACIKNDHIDTEPPVIDLTYPATFPTNCDTLYFGETFTLKMSFSDNIELGSFSLDIHHNFDHHSHSTEVTECNLDSVKSPLNPFVMIENYQLPAGINNYTINFPISLPAENGNGTLDPGDYHLMVRLTDKEGWSSMKGLSIKILHRHP